MYIKKYGLIGYPISHSFSEKYFDNKFQSEKINDAEYKLYPLEDIKDFYELSQQDFYGLNVTIPYKEAVLPYIDILSDTCKEIRAVNTIKIKNGKLFGFNTDVIGFEYTLLNFLEKDLPKNALVLGTGGASKAIIYVLKKLGIRYTLVSRRRPSLTYKDLTNDIINAHKLIINTTPKGMFPLVEEYPDLNYEAIGNKHFLYDLVYNPEKTIFLRKGAANGAKIKNGYDMLVKQAEASWTIWNQP